MQNVRIYDMPDCKMVSSGITMFGEERMTQFADWFSSQPRTIFPHNFLTFDSDGEKSGFVWLYLYQDGMEVPEMFDVVDFKGGLYAVTTDIDQHTDMDALYAGLNLFLSENHLQRDPSRKDLGNIIGTPAVREILGYDQMDYYTPVKRKEETA